MDERAFGQLEGQVAAMKESVDALKGDMETMHRRLDEVLTKFSEVQGGWKALATIASVGVTVGGIVTSIAHKLRWFG